MADIFIGYASEDRSRVKPLAEALEAQGWSVWWDWKSIPIGKTWRQAIEEGLEAARSVLVLWSKISIGKDWVIEEADFGKERKNLVPVIIDDVRPPIGFRQIQAARLIDWQGEASHTGFRQVVQALDQILDSPESEEAKEFKNSFGMNFVLIPAGNFMMGSKLSPKEISSEHTGWFEREHPRHKVTISKPFYLQSTAVTQRQWKIIMGNNPSRYKNCGVDCPVDYVSWYDAQNFMKKLNEKEKTDKHRLPTEAEWEYACRAGTTTEFFFGNDGGKLGEYAWYKENPKKRPSPVGEKKPNPWGLYNMHGIVFEWCEDWLGRYPSKPVIDPKGPKKGEMRVFRGGCWIYLPNFFRSAFRDGFFPETISYDVGFRVARDIY